MNILFICTCIYTRHYYVDILDINQHSSRCGAHFVERAKETKSNVKVRLECGDSQCMVADLNSKLLSALVNGMP